ncbi:MAG: hypothetical protein WCQ00_02280 [bacterium]
MISVQAYRLFRLRHTHYKHNRFFILQLTIGLAMLVSGIVGTDTTAVIQTQDALATTSTSISLVKVADAASIDTTNDTPVKTKKVDINSEVESKVRLYFADTPIMAEIVKCESRFRQFNADGSAFRGIANNQDVGIAQVNEYYHAKRAKKLGYDIYSVEGNMAYAKLLYQEEGTAPWISSAPCWKKSEVAKAMAVSKKILADNIIK